MASPIRSASLVIVALLGGRPALAQGGSFDGTWSVTFTCPPTSDGTSRYTRRFLVTVQDGMLHGEIGVRGQPAYLALDGRVQPSGQALLLGQGMTGNPDYAVTHPRPATPYSFTLPSTFAGSQGKGRRTEVRTCDAAFSRH
jgi:hypothetical protein